MKQTIRSVGHAFSGLSHALRTERNLRRFVIGHGVILMLGLWLGITVLEWILIVVFGGAFMIVELLNTALERLADTFDDCEKKHRGGHYHPGIKMTKDVAAAAALIALSMDILLLCLVFIPRVLQYFHSYS